MPICEPTTPSSSKTKMLEGDILDSSFDSYVFEEHKYSPVKINKEVTIEELFKKTLPLSLVSQKTPSMKFSSSSNDSEPDFNNDSLYQMRLIN